MQAHLRILAALLIAYGIIGVLIALGIFVLFGGLAAAASLAADREDSLIAVPLLAAVGTFTAFFLLVLSVPRIGAGIGLLKGQPWSRVLALIVAAIGLFDFPFGTALGIYALWAITRPEFDRALADQRR